MKAARHGPDDSPELRKSLMCECRALQASYEETNRARKAAYTAWKEATITLNAQKSASTKHALSYEIKHSIGDSEPCIDSIDTKSLEAKLGNILLLLVTKLFREQTMPITQEIRASIQDSDTRIDGIDAKVSDVETDLKDIKVDLANIEVFDVANIEVFTEATTLTINHQATCRSPSPSASPPVYSNMLEVNSCSFLATWELVSLSPQTNIPRRFFSLHVHWLWVPT
jgi:hypothetical protein